MNEFAKWYFLSVNEQIKQYLLKLRVLHLPLRLALPPLLEHLEHLLLTDYVLNIQRLQYIDNILLSHNAQLAINFAMLLHMKHLIIMQPLLPYFKNVESHAQVAVDSLTRVQLAGCHRGTARVSLRGGVLQVHGACRS